MADPGRKLKILIFGNGSAGSRHYRILKGDGDQDADVLPFLHDPQYPEISVPFPIISDKYDGFVIASPTPTHAYLLKQLAVFGKPILVEKPVTLSLEEYVDVDTSLPKELKENIYVGYQMRFLGGLVRLKLELSSGDFGNIVEVSAKFGHDIRRWQRENFGPYTARDGILLEASHELDYLKWVFPDIDVVGSARHQDTRFGEEESMATLVFASYNFGLLTLRLNYMQPTYERWVEVIGEKRTDKLSFTPELMQYAYVLQLREFCNLISQGIKPKIMATFKDSEWIFETIDFTKGGSIRGQSRRTVQPDQEAGVQG